MADVIWLPKAIAQATDIVSYLRQFDVDAARDVSDRLIVLGNSLREFPNRGRPAPNGTRELVSVPPYVLRYEVVGHAAIILAVRHGRQRPLP